MDEVVRRTHVAPEQGVGSDPIESAEAVAGCGLRGDRYFHRGGTFEARDGSDLTLVERKALAGRVARRTFNSTRDG